MDVYVCQREEGGQIYSVILLSKLKKKHSCLIFKENIVYYIYVVFNISMIKKSNIDNHDLLTVIKSNHDTKI